MPNNPSHPIVLIDLELRREQIALHVTPVIRELSLLPLSTADTNDILYAHPLRHLLRQLLAGKHRERSLY